MKTARMPAWGVVVMTVVVASILPSTGCKEQSLEQLLERRNYKAAEELCEKKEGDEKRKCDKTIAAYYLDDGLYEKAAFYYDKAGETIDVINCYYRGNLVAEAEEYCTKQTGTAKIRCAAHLARNFYLGAKPDKAALYYEMAKDDRMTRWVRGRAPVFQLLETIEKNRDMKITPEIRTELKGIAGTLRSYIYMESYVTWPYGEKTDMDKRAARTCEKAVRMIEETAAPAFFKKLKDTVSTSQWSGKRFRALSFPHAELDSLVKLIRYLHNIARYRYFFTKYSPDPPDAGTKKETNYEAVYTAALTRAEGLFETIDIAEGVTDENRLKVLEGDLSIDLDIIAYVSSLLDNLEIRIGDIQTRGKQYGKRLKTEAAVKKSEKLFRDFIALTGRVLAAVGKEEFETANDMLTTGYESIKNELTVKSKKNTAKRNN